MAVEVVAQCSWPTWTGTQASMCRLLARWTWIAAVRRHTRLRPLLGGSGARDIKK
jgi:hypothetical protein